MTENTTPTPGHAGTDAASQQYRTAQAAAWQAAVAALTDAVRLRHPQYGPLDFADFLASALASVAANVGSVDRLLAGRPGSWEADLVERLVSGTVGDDQAYLTGCRTQPVVIHLNVARLVEEAEDLRTGELTTPYERECLAIEDRYAELDVDEDEDEAAVQAEQAELAAVRDRWARRYVAYAQAFTTAVHAEAARTPGLTVPVTVQATTDPDASTDQGLPHPDSWDTDPDTDQLAWRLWCAAVNATPLPGPDQAGGDETGTQDGS